MSENKMDKYTWEYDENENLWYLNSSANDFISDVIFKSHIDAEYVCKALNENEARKNQPRISIDLKELIVQNINACTYFEKYAIYKMTNNQCENAIKAIESLEEEN